MKLILVLLVVLSFQPFAEGSRSTNPPGIIAYDLVEYICDKYMEHLNPKACLSHYYNCVESAVARRNLTNESMSIRSIKAVDECFLEEILL